MIFLDSEEVKSKRGMRERDRRGWGELSAMPGGGSTANPPMSVCLISSKLEELLNTIFCLLKLILHL